MTLVGSLVIYGYLTQLDDGTAQRTLTSIARARSGDLPPDLASLRDSLATEFDIAPPATRVSPGDLARQALLVLAEDSATRRAIEAMALEEPPVTRQTFDAGTSVRGVSSARSRHMQVANFFPEPAPRPTVPGVLRAPHLYQAALGVPAGVCVNESVCDTAITPGEVGI